MSAAIDAVVSAAQTTSATQGPASQSQTQSQPSTQSLSLAGAGVPAEAEAEADADGHQKPAAAPLDLDTLREFVFERVLSEAPASGSCYLLGTIRGDAAIVHVQRPSVSSEAAPVLLSRGLESIAVYLENQPYFSAHAKLAPDPALPDLQLKVTWPATETHILKHTAQTRVMLSETPEMYERVVRPYIDSFPPGRVEWVYNILAGKKEAERVLFRDEDPDEGFVILPDLKWDQMSLKALYLTAITQTRAIQSLRDLTRKHIPLLRSIRARAEQTVKDKFGLGAGMLRMYVHYHPSYYHFHVHIVHVAHEGFAGMYVGQAHLLEDLISLLELSPPEPEPSLLARMTLTYALGTEHKLCAPLLAAGAGAGGSASEGAASGDDVVNEAAV